MNGKIYTDTEILRVPLLKLHCPPVGLGDLPHQLEARAMGLSLIHIFNDLWDNAGDFVDDNTLSVYVRRLREKVEKNPSQPKYLLTVRGYGYQWKGDGT